MSEHYLAKYVMAFHHPSYLVGINTSFCEVVSAGCKKLALSSTLDEEQYNAIWAATQKVAKEYIVQLYVERDLLTTILFPRDIAKNKIVILMARDNNVINEYKEIKALKERHQENGTLTRETEKEIAHRFGALLSYDEESIKRLINKNGSS